MAGYLTIETVRDELQDRTPMDNTVELDLFWSDDDIRHAMERTASVYNGMPPMGVDVVHPTALPANTEVFMDGVLWNLYRQGIHKINRNIMSWQTGNTSVDLYKSRLEAFKAELQLLGEWKNAAKERKHFINQYNGWGYLR